MAVRIECVPRGDFGRRNTQVLRQSGLVPAVIYGKGMQSVNISIPAREVARNLSSLSSSLILELSCGDDLYRVVPKASDLHPVSSSVLHLDFVFAAEHTSKFEIPLNFVNAAKSEAIRLGAMLNVVRRVVSVRCSAANLPKSIPIDIGDAKVGDSIKFSDLAFPEGVVPLSQDANSVIATIIGKRVKATTAQ